MRRRDALMVLGGAAVWPLAARAQQQAMPVMGLLHTVTFDGYAERMASFRMGLKETGFAEGQNVKFEYREAQNQYDRLPALASDLVGLKVAAIATFGPQAARAAKAATTTVPIIFAAGVDAVHYGLVTRLNRPEANVTGVSINNTGLAPKRLELLNELVPGDGTIGLLLDPNTTTVETDARDLLTAGNSIGRRGVVMKAGTEQEIGTAFAAMVQQGIVALIVSNSTFFISQSIQIVGLAARYHLPAVYAARDAVTAGGLISYAPKVDDLYRQAGLYAGRILKGEKPADLPVLQPSKFELVLNLRTAKALGLDIPSKLLALADEVIE